MVTGMIAAHTARILQEFWWNSDGILLEFWPEKPDGLRLYNFNVVCGIKANFSIFTAFTPALFILVFQFFKSVTWKNKMKQEYYNFVDIS